MNLIEQLQIKEFHCEEKQLQAVMELREFHAQPFGFVHGGAWLAAAETVAGMATNALGQGMYIGVGQHVTAHHIRPRKSQGTVYMRGELFHKGKGQHIWTIFFYEGESIYSKVEVVNALITQTGSKE